LVDKVSSTDNFVEYYKGVKENLREYLESKNTGLKATVTLEVISGR
jgi:hypothetical protein